MFPDAGPPPGWQHPGQPLQHDPWLDFHWGDPQHHWTSHSGGVWEQMARAWKRLFAQIHGFQQRRDRRAQRKG